MTVAELIAKLRECPPTMPVCVWDHDQDEYVSVAHVMFEPGAISIDLVPEGVQVEG